MHNLTPEEDLLPDVDTQPIHYRSDFMHGWFKLCLGFLIYVHFSELYGIAKLRSTLSLLEGTGYWLTLGIYLVYIVFSVSTVIICVMFHTQSKYAVKAGIPVLAVTLLLGLFSLVGYFSGDVESDWRVIFAVLNVLVLVIVMVHAFRIRKQWAEAIAVR